MKTTFSQPLVWLALLIIVVGCSNGEPPARRPILQIDESVTGGAVEDPIDAVVGVVQLSQSQIESLRLRAGTTIVSRSSECLINDALADETGLGPGDTLIYEADRDLRDHTCKIAGIFVGSIKGPVGNALRRMIVERQPEPPILEVEEGVVRAYMTHPLVASIRLAQATTPQSVTVSLAGMVMLTESSDDLLDSPLIAKIGMTQLTADQIESLSLLDGVTIAEAATECLINESFAIDSGLGPGDTLYYAPDRARRDSICQVVGVFAGSIKGPSSYTLHRMIVERQPEPLVKIADRVSSGGVPSMGGPVVGVAELTQYEMDSLTLIEGQLIADESSECLINDVLAADSGLGPGDTLTFEPFPGRRETNCRIVGVFSGSVLGSNGYALHRVIVEREPPQPPPTDQVPRNEGY